MAGKKNHIIPKWLQKGFASRIDGKEVFTWMYRKDSKPFENNTGNINAENYFYGRKGELNADDVMTDVETNRLSPLMDKLRDRICNFDDSKTEIAELIAHFSIRTKTIRKGFEQMSEKTLEGFKNILTDDETVSEVLLKPSEGQVGEIFDDALNNSSPEMENALEIFQMFGLEKENVKNLIVDLTLSNLQDEERKEETKDFVKDLFSNIFNQAVEDLPNSIKKGHNQSLLDNTIPLPRVEKYEQLNWSIYETTSTLILGDVACIFKEIGEKSFKPSCEIDKTGQVYLPISSNQILVGTIDTEHIETDVKILNEAIASCSYEQFVCSENTQDKADLLQIIGTNAHLASDEEIEIELDEIRNNLQRLKDEQGK
jgi:hypothetical protein